MSNVGTSVVLTEAQRSVVEQPWDAWVLVTAGAGAGKTTTLMHRLEYLTGVEELEASEILVLSFSRAAVRELRDRVDRHAVSARRVRAQTFDGWASSVLYQFDPNRDLAGTDFDDRISMAITAVEDGVVESFENGPPAHIIIDEVQDLVGVRRDMVEALLDRIGQNCGFTVVGDAAQSIYGFQIKDFEERARETNRFFDWVRITFGDELVQVVLDDNFRARTEDACAALALGPSLQALPADRTAADVEARRIHGKLREILDMMQDFGRVDQPFTQSSFREFDGTAAVLCRDNGEVLWLSEQLGKYAVPHRVQRSPSVRPAPAWIADVINAAQGSTMAEAQFVDSYTTCRGAEDEPGRVWRSLRRVAGSPSNRLDVGALVRAIAESRIPDDLTDVPPHSLVLSTIHRAKGLEFDRVIVIEPETLADRSEREVDPPAEARLLYVAMTRPRDDLYRMSLPRWRWMRSAKNDMRVDRWYASGRESWMRFGIEASEWDVDRTVPAGFSDSANNARETQEYLRDVVEVGDFVELRRLHGLPDNADCTPPYGVFHDGRWVGVTSERFHRELHRVLQRSRGAGVRKWPIEISGMRVDLIETVAGSEAVAERAGLTVGVWRVPRLVGLGRFTWGTDSGESEVGE